MKYLLILLPFLSMGQSYKISIVSNTVVAIPEKKELKSFVGQDASTVIQSVINVMMVKGGTGGKIELSGDNYFLTKEVVLTGVEPSNPFCRVILQGEGYSTQIIQNTAGQNAIVVKSDANVIVNDLRIYTGSKAKSGLLADDTGATEISWWKGGIDNVDFTSHSTLSPALYLKNFFNLSVNNISVSNDQNDAIVLENNSKTTSYGNSHFGLVMARGSQKAPYAGLRIRSTNTAKGIGMTTFQNLQCIGGGYYGVIASKADMINFSFVDIEAVLYPVFLDQCRGINIYGGYIMPLGGGTAISASDKTGGCSFVGMTLDTDTSSIPISDKSRYMPPNAYDVVLGWQAQASKISILSAENKITYRSTIDGKTHNK